MPLNWGILGAGDIADRHVAPAMQAARGQRLVAVMRRDRRQAEEFAQRHGAARAYTNTEALVNDPEVTAIYVATPPHLHAANTILAAENGKHVLCEKPMAKDVNQARAMIQACRANNVRLTICYYQRFNVRHHRIKQLVDSGAIGQVMAARMQFLDYRPPRPGDWRQNPEISGGGPLMDLGPHCLDLLRYFCGPPVEYEAMVDSAVCGMPVEDTATLLLRMTNGAQAVICTHWSIANFAPERLNRVELYGTKGSIFAYPIYSKDSSGTVECITADGAQNFEIPPGGPRPHVGLLEAFDEAVSSGGPVASPGEEGLADIELLQNCRSRLKECHR